MRGLPSVLPSARALARPAFTRSWIDTDKTEHAHPSDCDEAQAFGRIGSSAHLLAWLVAEADEPLSLRLSLYAASYLLVSVLPAGDIVQNIAANLEIAALIAALFQPAEQDSVISYLRDTESTDH